MTSSQANQWQTHPVTTSSVSAGNSGIANLSQPGMMYPTYQVHIIAPDTHPQSIETGMQGGGGQDNVVPLSELGKIYSV